MSDFDADGYPSEEALKRIETWPHTGGYADLMQYVESLWAYKDCFFHDAYNRTYVLTTAGWSGNESVISALQANLPFWGICWYSSFRGGKHTFVIPEQIYGYRSDK